MVEACDYWKSQASTRHKSQGFVPQICEYDFHALQNTAIQHNGGLRWTKFEYDAE